MSDNATTTILPFSWHQQHDRMSFGLVWIFLLAVVVLVNLIHHCATCVRTKRSSHGKNSNRSDRRRQPPPVVVRAKSTDARHRERSSSDGGSDSSWFSDSTLPSVDSDRSPPVFRARYIEVVLGDVFFATYRTVRNQGAVFSFPEPVDGAKEMTVSVDLVRRAITALAGAHGLAAMHSYWQQRPDAVVIVRFWSQSRTGDALEFELSCRS